MHYFNGGLGPRFFSSGIFRKSGFLRKAAFREGLSSRAVVSRTLQVFAVGSLLVLTASTWGQAVSIVPTSLSWNSVPVGQTSGIKSVTFTNNQSTALTFTSITVDTNFIQSSTDCPVSPATLAAGATCTVSLQFRPLSQGALSGSLTFSDDAAGSPQLVPLSGTGTAGTVTFSPTSLTFPTTASGTVSAAQTATLTNTSAGAITLTGITHFGQFAETDNCPISPTTFAAGASCTVSVTFNPTSGGTLTGGVGAQYSATSTTLFLSGTATGGSGAVTLSPASFTFPNQATGTTSAPATLTLHNNQSVALNISSIQISAPFAETNTCIPSGSATGTVAANGTCTITLTYTPTAVGFSRFPLTITDDASGSPQSAVISGNSFAPLTVTPKTGLSFSSQIVGRTSSPQTVTVSNNQDAAITINSIAIAGNDFIQTNTCGNSLAGHSSCTITVSFDPHSGGFLAGSITISHNVFGSPLVIQLQGKAIIGDTGVSVYVEPYTACAMPSQTQQFTAVVTNTTNTAVSWYVDGVLNGAPDVGTISNDGLYTAPATQGTHNIKAISPARGGASGLGTITVTSKPSYGINPFTASVLTLTDQPFQAQICTVPDNNATFSVDNIPGGNSAVGTVSSTGIYTAPASPGRHTVRAFDASLNRTSGGVVTVYSKVAVDFGVRSNTTYPVPANIFGVNHADDLHNSADIALLAGAVSTTRIYAQIPLVYATRTPDWTKIDPRVASLQATGVRPILQLVYTPPFLQPSPNPCGAGNDTVPPSDDNQWGQIAASYVAHMDATFPGFIRDYEIWNEPNTGALCGKNVNDYLAIYAAAAPLMKQQAASDGATIRIGGPAMAGLDAVWVPSLLADPSTAPYVDFVSYHQYLYGGANREAVWDTFNGTKSVYQRMEEPGDSIAAYFTRAGTLTAAGKQPLGASTPIYLDEYNINYTYFANCCSDDPTFSPVYNGLFVSSLLNTVYSGSHQAPAGLSYFSANAYPYFCLIGTRNSFNDCQYSIGSTPEPYPQYYLYQLFSSPTYMGLKDGAFLAPAIIPTLGAGGLAVSGFNTATQNGVTIVNPAPTNYPQLNIELQNTGYTGAQAVLYQIVNGQSISQTPLALTLSPTGQTTYTATISVPGYSVLAIGIQGTPDQSPRSVKAIVSASPEPSLYQSPFAISVTISALNGTATPTGTVAFSVDGTAIGTAPLTNGTASINENAIVFAGSHIITAAYSGDANFNAATFSGTHVVASVATSTTVQGNPNPSPAGQPVVFTATVNAGGTPAPGQVTFSDDTTELGVVALDSSGVATLTTSTLSVGSHTITAFYPGEAQFAGSSAFTVEVITPGALMPTTTTLAAAPNPAQVGQAITFTATVNSGGTTIPSGQVSFSDGATQLGTATLDSTGVATLTTSSLTAGSHTITANYAGDIQFSTSSGTVTEVVNNAIAVTTTTVTASPNPAQLGQSVTFSAMVSASGSATVPTGQVTFSEGTTQLGSGALNSGGVATFAINTLAMGSHTITATYAGDAQSAASSGMVVAVVDGPPPVATTTTLASSLNPSPTGQSVTFTATVSASTGVPIGTVNFLDGTTTLAQGTLDPQGIASYSTSSLSIGAHSITAAYAGDAAFTQSTSSALNQVVLGPGDFSLAIAPPSIEALRGQTVTYFVTLGSINEFNGAVNFTCSVGGAKETTCAFEQPTLTGSGMTKLFVTTGAAHPGSATNRTVPTTLVMAGLFCGLFIRRKKWQSAVLLLAFAFIGFAGLSGCGSNGHLGTQAGTYTITVTGTSGAGSAPITHSVIAKLKVT